MLDPKLLRTDLVALKDKLATRGYELDVAFWTDVENKRKELQVYTEELQSQKNAGAKKIGELKRSGGNADELLAQMQKLSDEMKAAENKLRELQAVITNASLAIPNLPDDSVPVGVDESDNVEVRKWGTPRVFDFKVKDHTDIGESLGQLDFALASKFFNTSAT